MVIENVRVVKTPRPPQPPKPEEEPDCAEECAADRAMSAAAMNRRHANPRNRVEDYMVSRELARFLAYGRIE
ncbi:MAG TPA: hypothetical protein VKF17_16685 [Isosphaeraceae bacterium]|nr:hypothetical protein [Isosphaeraceae bacterium]